MQNDSVIRETFKYSSIHFSNSVHHISLICKNKNKIKNNAVIHLVNQERETGLRQNSSLEVLIG